MREATNQVAVERDMSPIATATTLRRADQAVFHRPERLSWVTLPHPSP
jgi:hypothetical protein